MSFQRSKPVWRIQGREITLGVRTYICAAIAFEAGPSRGAERPDAAKILAEAQRLEEEGADFIDIDPGGAHSAAERPKPDDELPRLVPVLRKMQGRLQAPLIVTTPNAVTAQRAVELGAAAVHDGSGLACDAQMARAVNDSGAALILGRMRGGAEARPGQEPLVNFSETVGKALQASLIRAHRAGIDRRRIVMDPGLERGKREPENFNLIRGLQKLAPAGQGIQATLTDVRFLLESVRAGDAEKRAGFALAATLALASGAHILRVAEPRLVKLTAAAVDRIYRADDLRGRGDADGAKRPAAADRRPGAPRGGPRSSTR